VALIGRQRGCLERASTDADARQVRWPVVEFAGQCRGVGGKITQRVRGCLGIDDADAPLSRTSYRTT